MSDFYKCKHGEPMCGTCTRGLQVQYNEMMSIETDLKTQLAIARKALEEIKNGASFLDVQTATNALAEMEGKRD